jgi:hypothetical protein
LLNNGGIRIILPAGSTLVKIPSPQFEAATIANLTGTGQTAAVAFYQKAFALYNNPIGLNGGTAQPVPGGGCQTGANAFTKLGAGVPCALQFRQFANTFTHERVWSLRIDQQIGKNDRLFGRYYDDNGLQATGTDPINKVFSAFSPQPAYQGQLSETHTFGATAVNQFLFSGFYYSAIFGQPDYKAAVAAFPAQLNVTGAFTTLAPIGNYPQGRIVKQWQYVDDFSKVWGKHSVKLGFNYHRNPFEDISNQVNNVGTITSSNLLDFYSGGGVKDNLTQAFPLKPSNTFAYNQFGAYIQDEWKATPTLKINVALRADHNGNLQCDSNCFSTLAQPFTQLAHTVATPYNSVIKTGLGSGLLDQESVLWEPRLGIAWAPKFGKGLVIRGGIGVFGDGFPLTTIVAISQNSPNLFSARAVNSALTPGVPGGLFAATAAANAAFQSQFAAGGTLASLTAAVPGFTAPRQTTADSPLGTPRYVEWNFEIQKELFWSTVLSLNYVGNHGSSEFVRNYGFNAYCDAGCGGFAGLPTSAPDPRFGRILQYQTTGVSNYDGLTVSVRRRFSHGFLFNFNYSYGHALDEISNGGRLPFVASTNVSETAQTNPYNLRGSMYGNADYDVRHNFTANYVWDDVLRHMFRGGPNVVFSGWTISGDIFHRTGLPFTVIDSNVSSGLLNYSGDIFAQIVGPVTSHTCGKSAVDTACFGEPGKVFADPTGFSNQARNQFFGPNNTNFNLSVTKSFKIKERLTFRIGASFYNLFNHPNFDQPDHDLGSGGQSAGGTFGQILTAVGPPTSIFGAFVGSQNAPRDIQFRTEIKF